MDDNLNPTSVPNDMGSHERPSSFNKTPLIRQRKVSLCHPEEPYGAKGMCKKCYQLKYRVSHGAKPRVNPHENYVLGMKK